MDIVVKGRRIEVSDRFRAHARGEARQGRTARPGLQRVDVEVSKEANPRLADRAFRVELTIRSRGPVIRAEAAAEDKYAALDVAWARLESRLRRAADRRTDHKKHDRRGAGAGPGRRPRAEADAAGRRRGRPVGGARRRADGRREKTHDAEPMTLDQALYEMELVGHDFFLFVDADSAPSVRRLPAHAYDYGVIRLSVDGVG